MKLFKEYVKENFDSIMESRDVDPEDVKEQKIAIREFYRKRIADAQAKAGMAPSLDLEEDEPQDSKATTKLKALYLAKIEEIQAKSLGKVKKEREAMNDYEAEKYSTSQKSEKTGQRIITLMEMLKSGKLIKSLSIRDVEEIHDMTFDDAKKYALAILEKIEDKYVTTARNRLNYRLSINGSTNSSNLAMRVNNMILHLVPQEM